MQKKLPEWYPPKSQPSTSGFVYWPAADDGSPAPFDMQIICVIDKEFYQPKDLIVEATYIDGLSDAQLVRYIREAHVALVAKATYDQIAAILNDPRGETGGDWTQENFREVYGDTYEIARTFSERDISEWRLACDGLTEYWNCDNPEGGYIYCLHDQLGHYKLGTTKRLDDRIKQLSTQPPFDLTLEFSFKVLFARTYESHLHMRYAAKRLRGEWFKLTPDDLVDIKRKAGLEVK